MARRFLLLSASTGSGHDSAAKAIAQELQEVGAQVEIIDCMDHVSPYFKRWFKGGYEMLVRESPWFWGYLYRTSDRPLLNYSVQTFLDWKCSWPIDQVIRDFDPDVIVCVHSVAQPRLPAIRKELGCTVAVVVTDLYPHRMWLRGGPDCFFVPTEASVEVLRRRLGGRDVPISWTGIPINRAFRPRSDREALRQKWLPEPSKAAIVLSSGGIGGGPFLDAVNKLQGLDANIIVLCGRNKASYDQVAEAAGVEPLIKPMSQVTQEDMGEILNVADILIGKSGGLTTFEALACGCPFIILKPFLIPGQEEDNAEWLDRVGAGIIVDSLDQLRPAVDSLIRDEGRRLEMRKAALANAKPGAAKTIAEALLAMPNAKDSRNAVRRAGASIGRRSRP